VRLCGLLFLPIADSAESFSDCSKNRTSWLLVSDGNCFSGTGDQRDLARKVGRPDCSISGCAAHPLGRSASHAREVLRQLLGSLAAQWLEETSARPPASWFSRCRAILGINAPASRTSHHRNWITLSRTQENRYVPRLDGAKKEDSVSACLSADWKSRDEK
jgi:hypothetical protein